MSIGSIAKELKVSKSSVSIWCNAIKLTVAQTQNLHRQMVIGSYAGRMKGAQMNREKRSSRIEFWKVEAGKVLAIISPRDILMLGLGLYLGEGSKTKRQFHFTNSDPALIKACLRWLEILSVDTSSVRCRLFINATHRDRAATVMKRWSSMINVPLSNFNNPIFIKARQKKFYKNHDDYLGVLAVRVIRSSELFYRILGLMDTFLYNIKAMRQGSLMVKAPHS